MGEILPTTSFQSAFKSPVSKSTMRKVKYQAKVRVSFYRDLRGGGGDEELFPVL